MNDEYMQIVNSVNENMNVQRPVEHKNTDLPVIPVYVGQPVVVKLIHENNEAWTEYDDGSVRKTFKVMRLDCDGNKMEAKLPVLKALMPKIINAINSKAEYVTIERLSSGCFNKDQNELSKPAEISVRKASKATYEDCWIVAEGEEF